jgi:polyhydroxyalkanoate synthesis repressor PhaR
MEQHMAEETQANGQPRHLDISKYPNRRYYDKTRSRHLTLEELCAAIREGYEVQVTDSKTGQDITAKVLAQILLELDAPKLDVFPVALLHQLLRTNQQLVTDFTQKYFNQAFSTFLDSQKQAEQYLRRAMGLQPATTPVTDWTKLMMWGPFDPARWTPPDTAANPPANPPPPQELLDQISRLQNEIAQLHEKLAGKREKETPAKKRDRR